MINLFLRPLLIGFGLCVAFSFASAAEPSPVYELRTYTTAPGKLDALLARFREHTTTLFEKHGMTNVGYFLPLDSTDGAGEKLIYLLSHPSRQAATASWAAFRDDPEWQAVSKASEAKGKIVTKVESVFLESADYSPAMVKIDGPGPHVFELRTYTTPAGGLPAIDARFRDHTCALFEKHGMTNVYYGHPLDADKGAGRTLIYLIAHSSRDAAKNNWAQFRDDPAWIEVKAASEKKAGGSLTTDLKSVFLTPTDFSKLK